MDIAPLGDSALILRVRDRFDDAPDETAREVLRVFRRLEAARIPGVIELAPAYTTVAVFFYPVSVADSNGEETHILDRLAQQIQAAVAAGADPGSNLRLTERVVEIPVCYDPEFGFDLSDVARQTGLSVIEIVDLHSAAEYRVSCIGFTPGFPFLSGMPGKLATPRRATPRKEIPAGSVGIGGAQTGIYPLRSPGGWNLIGRTPLRLFDPQKDPPTLLQAGDRVRIRSITRDEFVALSK